MRLGSKKRSIEDRISKVIQECITCWHKDSTFTQGKNQRNRSWFNTDVLVWRKQAKKWSLLHSSVFYGVPPHQLHHSLVVPFFPDVIIILFSNIFNFSIFLFFVNTIHFLFFPSLLRIFVYIHYPNCNFSSKAEEKVNTQLFFFTNKNTMTRVRTGDL